MIIPFLFHMVLRTVLNPFPTKFNFVQGSKTHFGLTTNFAMVSVFLSLLAALLGSLWAPATNISSKYVKGNTYNLYTALHAKEEISLWQITSEYF